MKNSLLIPLWIFGLFAFFQTKESFAQITTIDFENPPSIGAVKSVSVGGFTFASNLTNGYNIGFQNCVGYQNSYALIDGNLVPYALTRWTITKDGGGEFQFRSIFLQSRHVSASSSGTIRGYKNNVPVGSAKNVTFNSGTAGLKDFSADPDFFDIDEIRI